MPTTAKLAFKANAAQRARDYLVRQGIGATVSNLSGVLSVPYSTLAAALLDRAEKIGDMERRGRTWWPIEVETPEPTFKPKARGSGVIAGLRQPPDINAVWKGHSTPGPIRPGARDYEAIPSRFGGVLESYHGARATVPHVEPEVKRGRPAKGLQCKTCEGAITTADRVAVIKGSAVGPTEGSMPVYHEQCAAKQYGRNYKQAVDLPGVYPFTQASAAA